MTPESAEVRSPAPSAPIHVCKYEVLGELCPTCAQYAVTPSLREALDRLVDLVADCYEWDEGTDVDDAMLAARAALVSSDPGSPSDGGLDE